MLIVDDNAVNRRVLHEQVIGWKMRNGSCAGGEAALRALRQAHAAGDPYHIAIVDYRMPDMDGVTLGQAIKADRALRETALVLLTSASQPENAARLQQIGFAASLSKPARQLELMTTLLNALSNRTAQAVSPATRHSTANGIAANNAANASRPTIAANVAANGVAANGSTANVVAANGVANGIPARDESDAAPPAGEPRYNLRVLLAEDNLTNQKIAVMMLKKLGCAVDIAADGQKAVEMVEASAYDLVFMDCEMPRMDGFKATGAIRGRGDDKARVPIIAVTAQAMTGARDRCLASGMDDYISKPVHFEDFAAALEQWAPSRDEGRGIRDESERPNAESRAAGTQPAPDVHPSSLIPHPSSLIPL